MIFLKLLFLSSTGFLIWRFNQKILKYLSVLLLLELTACFLLLALTGYQFFIVLLPIISSYFFAGLLSKDEGLIDKLNIWFLILVCQVILIGESLSLLTAINGHSYLAATILIFLVSFFTVKDKKQSALDDWAQFKEYKSKLIILLKENQLLSFFMAVFLISLIWRIFLILYVPPNSWDAMTYHLSRVAYWLQNGSIKHFFTHYWGQAVNAPNTEFLYLWMMVGSKLDRFCGFVQFSCYLLSGTLLFICLRRYLKTAIAASLFIVLIWYSFPLMVAQSTSTQNDHVVAYFIMFSLVYFLLRKESLNKRLALSATALAVSAGVKITFVFYLLPFALILFIFFLKDKISLRKIFFWALVFLTAFLLLSSYNYILNYLDYGNFLSSRQGVHNHSIESISFKGFSSTLAKHLFNLITNQSGLRFYLGNFAYDYCRFIAATGENLFNKFNIPANMPGVSSLTW
ncbi:MAG: hypothetical protein JW867_03135, partial [Candidatus Omnitrophica bacterium]|nr:hypothetical protein [Candidatus Omnitrophota bacterium]